MVNASEFFIQSIISKISSKESISACEIGVGNGETLKKASLYLRPYDRYYFFDYNYRVKNIKKEMGEQNYTLIGYGNSSKDYDSYAWSLYTIYRKLRETGSDARIFDIVFLDASNIFLHDVSACVLIKKMLRTGGIVVLNNTRWSFESSKYWNPKNNEKTSEMLNDEQIRTSMMNVVAELQFESDTEYDELESKGNYRAFQLKDN